MKKFIFVVGAFFLSHLFCAQAQTQNEMNRQLNLFAADLRQRIGIDQNQLKKISHHRGVVAVIDSGLNESHWYLKNNLKDYVITRNGRIDHVSYDEIPDKNRWKDLRKDIDHANGHGTAVAGVIKHIYPKVPLKFFNTTSFQEFHSIVRLIVQDPSILVVNISKGYTRHRCCHRALLSLAKAGKIVVCSAGNDQDKKCDPQIVADLVNHPDAMGRILLVGATELKKGKEHICPFSVQACKTQKFFLTAPGYNILTCATNHRTNYKQSVEDAMGTSFSTPIVSGVLIFLLNQFPNFSIDEVILFLKKNVHNPDLAEKERKIYGCGQIFLKGF